MGWKWEFHGVEVTERRNLSARGAAGFAVFGGGFRCFWRRFSLLVVVGVTVVVVIYFYLHYLHCTYTVQVIEY